MALTLEQYVRARAPLATKERVAQELLTDLDVVELLWPKEEEDDFLSSLRQVAQIISLSLQGIPGMEISRQVRVSSGRVYNTLRGLGIETKAEMSIEKKRDIVEAYLEDGIPITQILAAYKLSSTTLYSILAELGIPLRRG